MSLRGHILSGVVAAALSTGLATDGLAADRFDHDFGPAPSGSLLHNWSGAYAGVAVGGIWSSFDTIYGGTTPPLFDFDARGVTLTGLGGFTTQTGRFVFGVEADFTFTNLDDSRVVSGVPVTASADWYSTLRGRVGYSFDNLLVYGTGGLAAGRMEFGVPGATRSNTELGWTVGAGVEMPITDNFTARAEYLYTDFGTSSGAVSGSPFSTEFDAHTIRAGVIYRFR